MTTHDRDNIEEQEIIEEMQEEINQMQNEEWEMESQEQEKTDNTSTEEEKLKDALARSQADFINFKQRVERDKEDMIFFLKSDILKKILPRIDDLQRMIQNTPEDMRVWALYEGIVSMETKLLSDLEKMWVTSFDSKWDTVDPDKHDVMTTVPGQEEWIIFDEFEKWYNLGDKVLRHAKVVVWSWV